MAGNILSIYSSKGGVGKSFIAVNLAVYLHLNTKKTVLLVDFSLPFSNDIAQLLNLNDIKCLEKIFPAAAFLFPF
jgi:cellulose biosynthesis protein BcsQ